MARVKVAACAVLVSSFGLAAASCGGSSSSTIQTVTVTTAVGAETDTVGVIPVTPSATSSGIPVFDPGYPKLVPVSATPERMSDYLRADGAITAVAVAPGVWVYDAPGTSADEDAASGDLIGWCASVQKFKDENPDIDYTETCW
jgi:hypothetical protein